MQRSASSTGDSRIVAGGMAVVALFVAVVAVQLRTESYESFFGLLTAIGLVIITVPVLRRISRRMDDPLLFWILLGALGAKFFGSLIRFIVVYYAYDGSGDSAAYHDDAVGLLAAWRKGVFDSELINLEMRPATTRRIAYLTGGTYVVTGPSVFAGFFFFSWLGYIGVVMCWRAVCQSVKDVDPRRAAIILLFYPSLLFWPASIGKDAVMLFLIGFTAYGSALLLGAPVKPRGLVWFLVGIGGMLLIRPHIGLMAVLALLIALALSAIAGSGAGHAVSTSARVGRIAAVLVLIVAASMASTQVTKAFNIGDGGEGGAEDALQETLDRTTTGGSAFEPVAVSTPFEIPLALVSVLFRPFPWEASGFATLIAAVEAALLLGLCAYNWRRIWAWPRVAWRNPYLLFAMIYCLAFVIGFSYIANFGILARQRTQMLPLFLPVLLVSAVAGSRAPLTAHPDQADDTENETAALSSG